LVVVLLEVLTVCWAYGANRFYSHIKEMNGQIPFINWQISWKYICPALLAVIIAFDAITFEPLAYGKYKFPMWSNWLGYAVNFFVLLPIPIYSLYIRFFRKYETTNL
jgi:hypothetical protein